MILSVASGKGGTGKSAEVEVAARIPFDNVVTEAIVRRVPVVEYSKNGVSREIERFWEVVSKAVGG